MTYKDYAELTGIDYEEVFRLRLCGLKWKEISGDHPEYEVKQYTEQWCNDTGKDFSIIKKVSKWSAPVISNAKMVDSGRINALWRAGWAVKSIAVDCHCTEESVVEVLNGKMAR